MKSMQTGAYITNTNQGNYIILPAHAKINIQAPIGMNILDDVMAEAFFTNNQGDCYHGISSGNYKVKDFNVAGLVILPTLGNPAINPQFGIMKRPQLWCDMAYKDVDSTAISMPARKPR